MSVRAGRAAGAVGAACSKRPHRLASKLRRDCKAFMQLSTRGRYAVMAMTDLAAVTGVGGLAVPLGAIAERQQISRPYLEQLFARLRRRGLVRSVRGRAGGYQPGAAGERGLGRRCGHRRR